MSECDYCGEEHAEGSAEALACEADQEESREFNAWEAKRRREEEDEGRAEEAAEAKRECLLREEW